MAAPKYCDHGVPFYGPPHKQKCVACEIGWYKTMLAYALEDVARARRSLIKRGLSEAEVDAIAAQYERIRKMLAPAAMVDKGQGSQTPMKHDSINPEVKP